MVERQHHVVVPLCYSTQLLTSEWKHDYFIQQWCYIYAIYYTVLCPKCTGNVTVLICYVPSLKHLISEHGGTVGASSTVNWRAQTVEASSTVNWRAHTRTMWGYLAGPLYPTFKGLKYTKIITHYKYKQHRAPSSTEQHLII